MNSDYIVNRSYKYYLLISIVVFAWIILYQDALFSAIRIWYVSEIFSHGFFILPGAFYLIWRERAQLAVTESKPNYWVLVFLVFFIFLGLLGRAGGIDVFTHIAAFTVLPLLFWFLLGNKIAKVIWFPLCFMLFSIPIGEELVPFLQKITADMAIFFLHFTPIPSFNSGLYIEIPQGKFVVAEACSGIRFFVGSLVFGAVYSHFSYRSFKRKLAFMLLAIIVPIIANALRVFSIVLIGYFVDMKYASGADHLIYGWVFFGIVLFLLVLIGESFRDEQKQDSAIVEPSLDEDPNSQVVRCLPKNACFVAAALLCFSFFWQMFITPSGDAVLSRIDSQKISNSFIERKQNSGWNVVLSGYSDLLEGYINSDSYNKTNAVIAWYPQNRERRELIASSNALFDKHVWSKQTESSSTINQYLNVNFLEIVSVTGQKRFVLYWYQLDGKALSNRFQAKIFQALDVVMSGEGAGALLVLSRPFIEGNREETRELLLSEAKSFSSEVLKALPF